MGLNDKILDEMIAHQVDLQKLDASVRQQVLLHLYQLVADLSIKIETLGDSSPGKVAKMEGVIKSASETIDTAYSGAHKTLTNQLMEVADIAQFKTVKILNDGIGAALAQPTFTQKDLEKAAGNLMIQGAPSKDWWAKQSGDLQMSFAQQIRMGFLAGESNQQLIQRIRGKATGGFKEVIDEKTGKKKKIHEFAGGIMDVSTRNAAALVRTSVQTLSNQVVDEVYKDNSDVIEGVEAVATLDGRTTPICIARDGAVWNVVTGKAMPESKIQDDYPGPPPWHWQCRTFIAPITKSWEQLIKEAGGPDDLKLSEVDEGTRASMDGQVAASQDYEGWLKTKPEEFQKEVLGPSKWQMWNDGKLPLSGLIDQSGNPLTVAELKHKYGMNMTDKEKEKVGTTLVAKGVKEAQKAAEQAAAARVAQEQEKAAQEQARKVASAEALAQAEAAKKKAEELVKAQAEKAELLKKIAEMEAAQKKADEEAKAKAEADAQKKAAEAAAKAKAEEAAKKAAEEAAKQKAAQEAAKKAAEEASKAKAAEEAKKAAEELAKAKAEAASHKAESQKLKQSMAENPPDFPINPRELKVVKKLGGTTGAELVQDDHGQLFVRKKGASADHIREEFAAEEMYRAAGVPVPGSKLYDDGKEPIKLSRYIDGKTMKAAGGAIQSNAEQALRQNFVSDALMGNWDTIGAGGAESDNILVGKDGVVYRIDVGGSLRFKAMGGKKTADEWNEYPTDLWSLRDPKTNPSMAKTFGSISQSELTAQAEALAARKDQILSVTPEALKDVVGKRIDAIGKMAKTSRTLLDDQFKDDYVSQFTYHQVALDKAGILKKLPKEMNLAGQYGSSVKVVDENGKVWDNLRGSGSVMTDLEAYIKKNGGDPSDLAEWASAQAGSSWSTKAQAVKAWWVSKQNVDADSNYYWDDGLGHAKNAQNKLGTNEKMDKTFSPYHVFTHELLTKTNLMTKDEKTGNIRLIRTESKSVMTANKIKTGETKVMKRGAMESTSMFRAVSVKGDELTVMDVPPHRILGTYWNDRSNGRNSSMFLGDGENEAVADLRGLKTTYVGSGTHTKLPALGKSAGKTVDASTASAFAATTPPVDYKKLKESAAKAGDFKSAKAAMGDSGMQFSKLTGAAGSKEHYDSYKANGGKAQSYEDFLETYFVKDPNSGHFFAGKPLNPGEAGLKLPTPVAGKAPPAVSTPPKASTSPSKASKPPATLKTASKAPEPGDFPSLADWSQATEDFYIANPTAPKPQLDDYGNKFMHEKALEAWKKYADGGLNDPPIKPVTLPTPPAAPKPAGKPKPYDKMVAQAANRQYIGSAQKVLGDPINPKGVFKLYGLEMHSEEAFKKYQEHGGKIQSYTDYLKVYFNTQDGQYIIKQSSKPKAAPIADTIAKIKAKPDLSFAEKQAMLGDKVDPWSGDKKTKDAKSLEGFNAYQKAGGILNTYADYLKVYFD